MRYITTLNNIVRADSEKLGFRAADLGVMREKGFNIPLTFIISNEAFEDFVAENGLKAKLETLFSEKNHAEAYREIISLFLKAELSKDFEQELIESYESLTIEPGASASGIVDFWDAPFVTIIRSPDYLLPAEDEEGVLQNVKGKEMLIGGVKMAWASLYSPQSIKHRQGSKIIGFTTGLVVQKMKNAKASAISYSRSNENPELIAVRPFLGLQDYGMELEGKDNFLIDPVSLTIKKNEINKQEFQVTRDLDKEEELVQRPLLAQGEKQKVNEKLVLEIARLTKRAKSFIGHDLKMYFSVQDELVSILHLNRMLVEKRTDLVEKIEIKESIDDSGNRKVTESYELTLQEKKQEVKIEMPKIISLDEAKEHVMKNEGHRIFSMEGFAKDEKNQSEPPKKEQAKTEHAKIDEKIVVVAMPEDQELSEESKQPEQDPEINLMEEAMTVKEICERMEEHALNGNKEAYEKEMRRLREIISRIK